MIWTALLTTVFLMKMIMKALTKTRKIYKYSAGVSDRRFIDYFDRMAAYRANGMKNVK